MSSFAIVYQDILIEMFGRLVGCVGVNYSHTTKRVKNRRMCVHMPKIYDVCFLSCQLLVLFDTMKLQSFSISLNLFIADADGRRAARLK